MAGQGMKRRASASLTTLPRLGGEARESRVVTSVSALLHPSQGPVGVNVTYGGDPIPKSPFSVGVSPSLDLSKIKVSGLGESK